MAIDYFALCQQCPSLPSSSLISIFVLLMVSTLCNFKLTLIAMLPFILWLVISAKTEMTIGKKGVASDV